MYRHVYVILLNYAIYFAYRKASISLPRNLAQNFETLGWTDGRSVEGQFVTIIAHEMTGKLKARSWKTSSGKGEARGLDKLNVFSACTMMQQRLTGIYREQGAT